VKVVLRRAVLSMGCRRTLKVAVAPSLKFAVSLVTRAAKASLSSMVAVALRSAAFAARPRFPAAAHVIARKVKMMVSSPSFSVSAAIGKVTVTLLSPSGRETSPRMVEAVYPAGAM